MNINSTNLIGTIQLSSAGIITLSGRDANLY